PVPTLAAINGNCLGGGLELALACDMRIMTDDTFIGMKETSVGVMPGAGGTVRLPRLIGESKAKQWIFSAQSFTPEEALGDGVIDWLVEKDELGDAVQEIFGQIAANAPLAIQAAKRSINEGFGWTVKQALEVEQRAYKSIISSEDRQEGLKAFREKRRPKWKGK
nr:enoyl-CoA hydratase-related protein [Dehalococcoidia bacterium]